jgi:hypothetical protein
MSSKHLFPAPDDWRCDAIAKPSQHARRDWHHGFHRCGRYAHWWCDGRRVCRQHFEMAQVRYAPGWGDRVAAYEAAMAKALGDEP